MKNNLFDRFKPKENKFFPLMTGMAETIVCAADLIILCVQVKSHEEAVEYYKKIKEQERKADSIQNQIFEELNETFITPFDREDINHLSSTMDDVTDLINSCAKRIMLYSPKSMPEAATRLATFVRESAGFLVKAIHELGVLKKNTENIKDYCEQLGVIEKKADDVYEHFLIDLFENETDAIEVIKLKDILHELERATDAAEAVGKIIKTMIVKYS
jgi:predicted phosphate transport protein (TIGR00153 family)